MASALKAAKEYLICPLCKNNFDDPKTLVCLHSFCKLCISDHIVEKNKTEIKAKGFECPTCQKQTSLSEFAGQKPEDWSSMLPTNEALSNILTALNEVENRSPLQCPRHLDHEVEFFCEDHEVFACSLCSNQSHNSCRKIHPIADAVRKRRENVSVLTNDLSIQISETEKILNNRQDQVELIESKEDEIKQEITEMKKQVNDFFSQMETKVLDAIAEVKNKELGSVQLEINICHQIIQKARDAITDMSKTDEKNPIKFVEKYNDQIKSYEERQEKFEHVSQNLTDLKIKYLANREIEKAFHEAESIGSLSVERVRGKLAKPLTKGTPRDDKLSLKLDAIKESHELSETSAASTARSQSIQPGIEVARVSPMKSVSVASVGTHAKADSDEEEPVLTLRLEEPKVKEQGTITTRERDTMVTARFLRDFNVAVDKEYECSIEGAAMLASGHIVLTDSSNKCLKLFDEKYNFLAFTRFSVAPGDLTVLSEKEVLVCLPEMSRVKHERIDMKNKKITAGEVLTVNERCHSISFSNRKMAVCSTSYVYIFQRQGSSWVRDASINVNVTNLKFVALDSTAERIVVSRDGYPNRSIICMNITGLKLWTFTHEEIRLPRGIAFCGNKILVAVFDHKTIIQLNGKDGRYDGVVVQDSCLQWPCKLCLSPKGDKMLLTQSHHKMMIKDKKKILVFRLTKCAVAENESPK